MIEITQDLENIPTTSYTFPERPFDPFSHLTSTSFLDYILSRQCQNQSSHQGTLGMPNFSSFSFPMASTSSVGTNPTLGTFFTFSYKYNSTSPVTTTLEPSCSSSFWLGINPTST